MYIQSLFEIESLEKIMHGKAQYCDCAVSATCYCEEGRQVAMSL